MKRGPDKSPESPAPPKRRVSALTSINVTLPLDTLVSELSIARCQLV
ncbi:hypothetical protein ACUOA5_04660, partial [Escherichia coli]